MMKFIKTFLIFSSLLVSINFQCYALSNSEGNYKLGCKAICANGTCTIVGKAGSCSCVDGQPVCEEKKSGSPVKLIEDSDGNPIAADEASVQKFFEMVDSQSKPKVTIENQGQEQK